MSENDEIYQKRDIMMARMDENLQHMKEWTISHTADDDRKHLENNGKFEKIDKSVAFHSKVIYGGLGIIGFIEFMGKFIK